MSEYIDREKLISDIKIRYCKPCEDKGRDYKYTKCRACWVDDMIDEIEDASTAEVVEVKHGKPIVKNRPEIYEVYKPFPERINGNPVYAKEFHFTSDNSIMYCYSCGKRLCSRFTDYCPNCGAKMDLEGQQ